MLKTSECDIWPQCCRYIAIVFVFTIVTQNPNCLPMTLRTQKSAYVCRRSQSLFDLKRHHEVTNKAPRKGSSGGVNLH